MRALLITCAICWTYNLVHAQPELGLELKGGFNAATLARENRENRLGPTGGAAGYLQWPLMEQFSFAGQVEALYTPRGARAIADGEYLGQLRQHCIDLNMMARPEVWFGQIHLYILLGGGLNFLLSANQENASGSWLDITGDIRRIDVALLIGAGVALRLPRGRLGPLRLGTIFLEARHDHGLIDLEPVGGGFKNRTSSIMLGLSFMLSSGKPADTPTPPSARSEPMTLKQLQP